MTSTPTRPVDNVVIAAKGLQHRNINIIAGTTVENKGKLILTESFKTNDRIYTLGQKRSSDIREQLGIFNIDDKLTQYNTLEGTYTKNGWEDNIRMDLEEIIIKVIGLIRLRIGIIGGPS